MEEPRSYLQIKANTLHCISRDVADFGAILWSYEVTSNPMQQGPVYDNDNGYAYIIDLLDGRLYKIDVADGSLVPGYPFRPPALNGVEINGGGVLSADGSTLYYVAQGGTLTAFSVHVKTTASPTGTPSATPTATPSTPSTMAPTSMVGATPAPTGGMVATEEPTASPTIDGAVSTSTFIVGTSLICGLFGLLMM